ncbi:EamA family transporter RarD [Streptococcus tangpeifui]|uniref:EamA family transporter RarD n=1 Tax=Streptococcus tangpeifui TaxID=2709400 RepID=UPI0013ED2154|nr:EamA family transporter RarD [Streptococcus sp. ZJ373]
MTKTHKGLLLGVSAYLLWAFLSLYWKLLAGVNAYSTFSYRIIWTLLTMAVYMLISKSRQRYRHEFRELWLDKRQFYRAVATAFLIAINWLTYIYAIANGHATESSLGYYMMPLVSVLLALVILKESLTPATSLAVLMAAVGVGVLVWQTGHLPWIALLLAFTFGFYGLLKKGIRLSSDVAMLFEAGIILPFVLVYLIFFSHETLAGYSLLENILLALSGIVTAIPLLLYAESLKRAPLNLIGFIQYLNPTIQLLIALTIFKESLSQGQLYGLVFIWLAIGLFVIGQILLLKRQKT